jgi:hypothetical protein
MHFQSLSFHYLPITNIPIWNCKMEILLVGANLSSIVDGIEIDLDGTNLALQSPWKNKDDQARC